jgi:hypothetical protein
MTGYQSHGRVLKRGLGIASFLPLKRSLKY